MFIATLNPNFKLSCDNLKFNTTHTTKKLYKTTSSTPYSGMMDFLPNEQLYKIDYKKLVIEQRNTLIEQLMQFFNSKQDIMYYKTQIKLYHERNLEII